MSVANQEVSRLNAFVQCRLEMGLYEGKNPVIGIRSVKEPAGRLRFLDYAEEATLLKVAPSIVRDVIVIGTTAGFVLPQKR